MTSSAGAAHRGVPRFGNMEVTPPLEVKVDRVRTALGISRLYYGILCTIFQGIGKILAAPCPGRQYATVQL